MVMVNSKNNVNHRELPMALDEQVLDEPGQ
jgi:hypothetical protein